VDDSALIAVIGTRKASPYGLKMAGRLSYGITKCGGIVVSGLTAGIDAEAAKAALMAGGTCIGVLGTAHEENRSPLARDVAEAGALISEYPPGTVAQKSFFRARNRISAGLSVGTVVVEAPKGSGALLFAREALEQGKEIFAVPGNADSANSAGTIELLKDGAKPVTEAWYVIGEFSSIFPESLHPATEEAMPTERENLPLSPATPVKDDGGNTADLRERLSQLSEQQLSIVTAIDSTGRHIDDIIEETALTSQQVMGSITMLEIKGIVRRLPGNRIALNIAKK